jgi:glycosyltransferase involved in cell wall biosynthesis
LKVFPRLSETFILHEILELEAQGVSVEIFSLHAPNDSRFHGALSRLRAEITYLPRPDSGEMWQQVWSRWKGDCPDAVSAGAAVTAALGRHDPEGLRLFLQGLFLSAEVRRRGIDHLHAHFASSATGAAWMAHLLCGVSFSFTAHAKDIYHCDQNQAWLAEALRRAAFVVTVTDYNAARLAEICPEAEPRIRRIYNGIPTDSLRPAPSPETATPVVVSVGRLVEKKGFPYLIEACQVLRDRGRAFRCLIIGAGDWERRLQDLIARLELSGVVRLCGSQSHESVVETIAASHIMALPCIVGEDGNRDALPTVLLEAMALARPVVSTDLEGVTEIVDHEHTGLLVPQRQSAALADALERLLLRPELRESYGYAGRRKVERLFNLRHNAGELAQLYRQVESAVCM